MPSSRDVAFTTDAESGHFAALYEAHVPLLISIATRKFRVPESDAEDLANSVFLAYLQRRSTITDLRGWLIGAICHSSRDYWRRTGRRALEIVDEAGFDRVDPATARVADVLPDQVAAREALASLSPRCQEMLRLRYIEGYTIEEIAEKWGVKPKYAQKLVAKCLRRAESLVSRRDAEALVHPPQSTEDDPAAMTKLLQAFADAFRSLG